jgi:hypothetical protein
MRTKSQYREAKPEIPAAVVEQPDGSAAAVSVEHHGEPESEPVAEIERDESEALRQHAKEVSEADSAGAALKRQIEELARSEQLQKQAAQYAAQQQQRPPTREEKLALWRQQGMPDDQVEFLKANPELVDYSELAAFAAGEALQAGHERGSHDHMRATKEIFDKHLAHLQAQAQQQIEPAMTPTPKFFAPPPSKPPRASSVRFSAPVSRDVPSAVPPSERYTEDPRRVTLSVDEREIARASGISETEYARQKIRLEREKREGTRQ